LSKVLLFFEEKFPVEGMEIAALYLKVHNDNHHHLSPPPPLKGEGTRERD